MQKIGIIDCQKRGETGGRGGRKKGLGLNWGKRFGGKPKGYSVWGGELSGDRGETRTIWGSNEDRDSLHSRKPRAIKLINGGESRTARKERKKRP